jgi:hypothetical protein
MDMIYIGSLSDRFNDNLKKKKHWVIDKPKFRFGRKTSALGSKGLDFGFDENDTTVGDTSCDITQETDGFYWSTTQQTNSYIYITSAPYFLSNNMNFLIGNVLEPSATLQIIDLGFPKIRVNFNGYRLKTKIQDVNWSNFYHINEDSVTNGILKLGQGGQTEIINLVDTQKDYLIGTGAACDIRIKSGKDENGIYGKIKFVNDIGWVIKAIYDDQEKIHKEGIYLSIQEIAKRGEKGVGFGGNAKILSKGSNGVVD